MNHSQSRFDGLKVFAACVMALGLSIVPLVLVAGAFRDPTQTLHGMVGSALWTTFGPHLFLASLIAFVFGFLSFRRLPHFFTRLVLVLTVLALIGSAFVNGRIIIATYHAGGAINPLSSLVLKSMVGDGPDEIRTITASQERPLQAAVYRPSNTEDLAPVIVYVHGGGFMTGSMTETDADLRYFADRGWLVVSLDYRLFPEGEPTWNLAPEDIACGAAWVKENAQAFGGDYRRLTFMGDSAGGNLALNYAYNAALGAVATTCGEVPIPSAVVVQYPAVDPIAIYEFGYPISGFEPQMLVSGYLGGSPHEFPDRVRAVSSYSYVHANAPPTLILSPAKDGLVPAWSVVQFAEYAQDNGVDLELVTIPFANHVYNQLAANSLGNQARRSITVRYLVERGLSP